ncbi:MAG: hypothetical protein LC121_17100 [Anaerolineae bacterium]|nr:hypothetical protein [Anaerolineae bacterium]
MQTTLTRTHPRKKSSPLARQETIFGILFAMPAILGLLLFSVGPILASFGISFTNWSLLARRSGSASKITRNALHPLVGLSLGNTPSTRSWRSPRLDRQPVGRHSAQPEGARAARVHAGVLPALDSPAVAVTVVWLWLLDPNFGLVNMGCICWGCPRSAGCPTRIW